LSGRAGHINTNDKTEVLQHQPSLCLPLRTICAVSRDRLHSNPPSSVGRCELDSHADTCVAGSNFIILEHTNRTVDVRGYSAELKTIKGLPIVTAATVYTSDVGLAYILVIHECIFFGTRLRNSLICPNQLRAHGIVVNDVPTQFDPDSTHSIITPELSIPLDLLGVISYFETRVPNQIDFDTLPTITLTATNDWVNQASTLPLNEKRIPDRISLVSIKSWADAPVFPPLNTDRSLGILMEDDTEYTRIISSVQICATYTNEHAPIAIDALSTNDAKSILTAVTLSKKWTISLETAKATLKCSTQTAVRNIFSPSERKVRMKAPWLNFPSIKGDFYVDSMFSKVPSISGYTGGSLFTDGLGYDRFYPWKKKSEHADALMQFIHDVGVPQNLISDNAKEEILGRARDICTKYRINVKTTVPHSPWQNLAEASIRETKKHVRRTIRRTGAPPKLWAACTVWATGVRRLTASSIPQLHGRTPTEHVEGSTPDISSYALFEWYQPVYYWNPTIEFPHERKLIGRWIGVAEACTDEMAFLILTKKSLVLIRKSVWALTDSELAQDLVKQQIHELDESIKRTPLIDHLIGMNEDDILYPGHEPNAEPSEKEGPSIELHGTTPEELDEYLSKDVLLPRGGQLVKARVLKRTRDGDGIPKGSRHRNPILDTREYEVEFPDNSVSTYTANIIAENLSAQADIEAHPYAMFVGIEDHRKNDDALTSDDVNNSYAYTTLGWDLLVRWVNGITTWLPLSTVKESNPIETAEYAVSRGLDKEPAFRWWARKALRTRDRIISKVKTRYWKKTQKYGIELPKSVKQALAIDSFNEDNAWREAIAKEMKNVMAAFEFKDDDKVPTGYKKIDCHIIFDVKVDLTRKARLVAGGHQTEVPKDSVYSSVVSRDSVRLAFALASLNNLSVLAADVQNAYLNAPTKEKCYTIAGPEFGPDNEGRPVLIVRALYGLRSSGARWRDHLASTIRTLGFGPCLADPDVWLRRAIKPGGNEYYEYLLVYVDDILVVSHDPKAVMDLLAQHYTLKAGSVRTPKEYLGSDISSFDVPKAGTTPATTCWSMSAETYIKRAVKEVKRSLSEIGQRLKTKSVTPMTADYRAELDTSPELDDDKTNYFQGLIGVLRWIVELGRIDIMVAVTFLSRYLASPREGHLEQAFHIFSYLDSHERSKLAFDGNDMDVDASRFNDSDWSQYYPDAVEAIPPNMPPPLGMGVTVSCYCDADHAGCRMTRRSHTGILIYVQNAPIIWYSKRQNTVESSTFGSEFIAMKTAVEQIEALRYKLRMMGVPVLGPANIFCDNESVFKNCAFPESTIKKKHNAIAYHKTREAQASKMVRVAWEKGDTNRSDILTKLVPGPRLRDLSRMIMF
jgi:Reverse transcriptase (RNA-dependent DNA polymerase)